MCLVIYGSIGFNNVFENKNYQSFDKQLIEKNAIKGHIEQNAIGGSKQIGMRGEQYNDYAIQKQQADNYEDLDIAELREQVARAKIRADTRAREEKKATD